MNSSSRTFLIVIPTYNEAANILNLLKRIIKLNNTVDILVVDDNSPDGTATLVTKMIINNSQINLLSRTHKLGFASAYLDGFNWGMNKSYSAFIQMDADLSHNPDELKNLIEGFVGVDFVIGSRYCAGGSTKGWSLLRKMISRFGNLYAKALLKLPYHDITSGYTVIARNVLETIGLNSFQSNGYSFQYELKLRAHQAGFKIKEIPIVFGKRYFGKSKLSMKIILEALFRMIHLRKQVYST